MKTILSALLVLLLAGCAAPAPITVEVTRPVIQTQLATVVVTQIVERVITATPVPVTPTPEPTPTPVYEKFTADQVLEVFKAAGLEAEGTYEMTADDYHASPNVAKKGIRFLIPSLCYDCGGRILAFDNPDLLNASRAYYEALGKQGDLYFSWVFVRDNILVQINGDLPEAKADQYKAALESMP